MLFKIKMDIFKHINIIFTLIIYWYYFLYINMVIIVIWNFILFSNYKKIHWRKKKTNTML